MLTPGPDHPITLRPAETRWRAEFDGHVIADSADALILQEASYAPVVYFPREDVALEYAARTHKASHCPYKGDASYYTFKMHSQIAEDVAWSYDAPFESMGQIAGRIAFYPDRVRIYEVDDAAVNPRHPEQHTQSSQVDEIVRHTDSGSGASQRDHWAPNVTGPTEGGLR
jgi:uncharacterized protein (DUF427 family)